MKKYIQIYEDFLDDKIQKTETADIQELKDNINAFKSKKGNLERLILSNINTDKDISRNIDQIIDNNKYLKMYLSILNIQKSLKKNEDKVTLYKKQIDDKNTELRDLNNEKVSVDSKQAIIDDIKTEIQKYNDSIKQTFEDNKKLQIEAQKLEAEAMNILKADEEKCKQISKNNTN